MDTLITKDNEIDIMLSLSLDDLRHYCQLNNHTYQLCKTNRVLNDKLRQINNRIEKMINIVDNRDDNDFYLNTIKEYDKFKVYRELMTQLRFNLDYNGEDDDEIDYELDDFMIMTITIKPSKKGYKFNFSLVNFEEGTGTDVYGFATLNQTKEFLLQLYYNDLIF